MTNANNEMFLTREDLKTCHKQLDKLDNMSEKQDKRIENTQNTLRNEMFTFKDEMGAKIEQNETYCTTNFDLIRDHSNKDRNIF